MLVWRLGFFLCFFFPCERNTSASFLIRSFYSWTFPIPFHCLLFSFHFLLLVPLCSFWVQAEENPTASGGQEESRQRRAVAPARSKESESMMEDEEYHTAEPEAFEMGEDVYSLIFISPICSASFVFGAFLIALKMTLFTFLALDLHEQSGGEFTAKERLIRATQFFLLPVAIAMQEDLIHVYTRIANIRYDKKIMELSESATEWKFALSFILRFLDGLYSLIINFVLLLITDQVLSLFLNFAALAFLQSIDDVAFQLAANGYLGDRMEDNCTIVKSATLPRRVGDRFTNALDTVLFLTTYLVMLAIFIYVIILEDLPDN